MTLTLGERIQQLLASAPEADRFAAVLALVLRHFAAETGTIHRLDTDGHLYLLVASAGMPAAVLAVTRRIPLGKGIAGEAAERKKPVSICNLQTDASGVARPAARTTGVQGALCVPILEGERVVGTLGIGCMSARTFTDAEAEELTAAGRAMAAHVDRARS